MKILPTELLCEIESYPHTEDDHTLRAVNSIFAKITTKLVFDTVQTRGTLESVERARCLLEDRILKHFLKTLVFEKDIQDVPTYLRYHSSAFIALRKIIETFPLADRSLTTLLIHSLGYQFIRVQAFSDVHHLRQICKNLTSLDLKLRCGCDIYGVACFAWNGRCELPLKPGSNLQLSLANLKHLTSLNLELQDQNELPRRLVHAPSHLHNIVPLDTSRASLRKLSLLYFDTTPNDFLQLMRNHACSLKALFLNTLRLEHRGGESWNYVFKEMALILSLDHACLRGRLEHYDGPFPPMR